jgi:hypothetical protein
LVFDRLLGGRGHIVLSIWVILAHDAFEGFTCDHLNNPIGLTYETFVDLIASYGKLIISLNVTNHFYFWKYVVKCGDLESIEDMCMAKTFRG